VLLLDVGLCSSRLSLQLHQLQDAKELTLVNSGGIAEQLVGQLLRTAFPYFDDPSLYYWLSAEQYANAKVDYVIQHQTDVVPLEVKAGATGALKSLHLFMEIKKRSYAVRVNAALPKKKKPLP